MVYVAIKCHSYIVPRFLIPTCYHPLYFKHFLLPPPSLPFSSSAPLPLSLHQKAEDINTFQPGEG